MIRKKIKKTIRQIHDRTEDLTYSYGYHLEHSDICPNTILLESFHGKTISDSPLVCAGEIERLYPGKYRMFFAVNNKEEQAGRAADTGIKAELLDIRSEEYAKVLATAEYIISNASLPAFFVRRSGQKYLQTWHGTPLKTLGKEMREGIESMYNVQHNFLQATHIMFPNEFTRSVIMRDYNLERLYTGRIVMSGYPRNEVFFDHDNAEAIRSRLGISDKKVYAYMPTWRGTSNRDIENESYFEEVRNIFSRLDRSMRSDQLMFVGFHPIIAGGISFDEYDHIRAFPSDISNYEFLNCTDALITDYSSVFFDYALTSKPIVLFMYDYEKYMKDRGMYFDVKDLPFRQIYDVEEFCSCISSDSSLCDDYSSDSLIGDLIKYDSPDCTENLLRCFLEGDESKLQIEDYSRNSRRQLRVISPERFKNLSDIEATAQFAEISDSVVLLYRKWFKDGIGQMLHDKFNDRFDYIITSDSPPRTKKDDILAAAGSKKAAKRIKKLDNDRIFPNLQVQRPYTSDVGMLHSLKFGRNGFRVKIDMCGWDADEIKAVIFTLDNDENTIIKADTVCTGSAEGCTVTADVDYSAAEFVPLRWNCFVLAETGGREFRLRVRVRKRRIRYMLKLGNMQSRLGEKMILYPYTGSGARLKLCCREDNGYDNCMTRIKEIAAMLIYLVLRKKLRKKDIHIIYEKFCRTAQDNGVRYFEYCRKSLPESERNKYYYVIDKKSEDYQYVSSYGRAVIPFMSIRHMVYAMAANIYIATDSVQHLYAWRTKQSLVFSRIEKKDVFFLQHGVTAMKRVDHIFGSQGMRPMKYFAATSDLEKDIIVQNFGYKEENVPITGFTRWDALEDKSSGQNRILLIMPTWRVWLEDSGDEEFRNSDYYRHYQGLISSSRFTEMLEENDLTAIFYLHPKFAGYLSDFTADSSDRIRLVPFGAEPLNEIMMRSSMMITDYSSVCWDMLYMDKPVIYYHFDLDRYLEEHGAYIDLRKDLPGVCAADTDELLEAVGGVISDGYRIQPAYAGKLDRFYAYRDKQNCRRTYEFLRSCGR